jgi:hypothetical protein
VFAGINAGGVPTFQKNTQVIEIKRKINIMDVF